VQWAGIAGMVVAAVVTVVVMSSRTRTTAEDLVI
jgi:hypothetical protein